MSAPDTISLLNRLIVCEMNGQACMRAAAEEVPHRHLHDALMEYAEFFGASAHELQDGVRAMGGTPAEIGSFGNTLHRTWMHLKATALGRDEAVILDSVDADEAEAEHMLADAMHWDTEPGIHAMIERQFDGVRNRHAAIQTMRGRLDA